MNSNAQPPHVRVNDCGGLVNSYSVQKTWNIRLNYLYYIFPTVVIIKAVINIVNYYQCKRLLKKYNHYIKVESDWSFLGYQKKIIQLFEDAGLSDTVVPVIERVDFNHVMKAKASFYDNLNNDREDVVSLTLKAFHQAIGVYRIRIIDAVNPLFWIKLFIYLPKRIFSYLGIKSNNVTSNIIQLFYWATSIIIGLLSIDDIEILKKIKDWINTII